MSSVPEPAIETEMKEEVKQLSDVDLLASKEHLSGLFTILAAGFGLVSDGCKCLRFSNSERELSFVTTRSEQCHDHD